MGVSKLGQWRVLSVAVASLCVMAGASAAGAANAPSGAPIRTLESVVADDETTPTAGVSAARKLIDVDGVVAITGVWSSAVALAVRPVALE